MSAVSEPLYALPLTSQADLFIEFKAPIRRQEHDIWLVEHALSVQCLNPADMLPCADCLDGNARSPASNKASWLDEVHLWLTWSFEWVLRW